jgi:hypothetical protein
MISSHKDGDGGMHYRSRSGLVAFGVWSLLILAGVVYTAWSAVTRGEPPWFFVVWIAGILVLGLYSMALDVTLTPHGALVFRGALRRQTRWVADVRSVRPGTLCIVFKFKKGGTAVAASWGDGELVDLCRRIKTLNPEASLNMPGMFRLPPEPAGSADER